MKIEHFVEFGAIQTGAYSMGWYASAAKEETDTNNIYYYLHDDGNVYDYCWDEYKQDTTGWFKGEEAAMEAVTKYYKKYGLVYPYAAGANPVKSELMEF